MFTKGHCALVLNFEQTENPKIIGEYHLATNPTQASNVFWVNVDLKHYQHCVVNLSLDRLDTFVNNQLIRAFFCRLKEN